MMRFFVFSFIFICCGSLKKSQKQTVSVEKKEVKITHKKDSLRSVFSEKTQVILEDTGRIITYELAVPATLKEVTQGSALVQKIVIEEKKINQKTDEDKKGEYTAVGKQKDSSDVVLKGDKTQEISIKKTPQTWRIWLWIIAGIIIIGGIFYAFKRFLKWRLPPF